MRAWRKVGGLGRFPEGGGFATGFWQIWEDKAEKANWVQVRKTLACQVRTLTGSGDSWRGARPDGLLTISVQSSRDTDIWTSDGFLEIGRCYWPEGGCSQCPFSIWRQSPWSGPEVSSLSHSGHWISQTSLGFLKWSCFLQS